MLFMNQSLLYLIFLICIYTWVQSYNWVLAIQAVQIDKSWRIGKCRWTLWLGSPSQRQKRWCPFPARCTLGRPERLHHSGRGTAYTWNTPLILHLRTTWYQPYRETRNHRTVLWESRNNFQLSLKNNMMSFVAVEQNLFTQITEGSARDIIFSYSCEKNTFIHDKKV